MHDDNSLMERVQGGDKLAYETIVLKHRPASIRFANSFVLDAFIAEDIVQECFVKIYVSRMSYKSSGCFKTFLFTVIRNSCIDYLRKMKTNGVVSMDCIQEIAEINSLNDALVRKEEAIKIFKILNSLKGDYKTALYLFAVDEMSYKEIAKIMQKTTAQIKIIIHRARKKLKRLYDKEESDEELNEN